MNDQKYNSKRIESFSKVRRIKTTQSADRGNLFTRKNLVDGFVEFESLLEEGLYQLLDHDPNCIDMESQPLEIPNENGNNYTPDVWAKFKDGKQFIFDVKHTEFLESLKDDKEKREKWEIRVKRVKKYCKKHNLLYEIVTNSEIWNERYENIDFFGKNIEQPKLLLKLKPYINNTLDKESEISRIQLALSISEKINLDIKQIIPSIDHLIYHDFFLLDFNTKITDDTILIKRTNEDSLISPVYQYLIEMKKIHLDGINESLKITINPKSPYSSMSDLREFQDLPIEIQEKIQNQINHLDIFDKEDFSTKILKNYAIKIDLDFSTLYRWKSKFEKMGWRGLIPNHKKAGRKRAFDENVEQLIQKVIEEYYLRDTQPSISGSYQFFKMKCKKQGIKEIPSYDTFRSRIKEISNIKKTIGRRGRKINRDIYKPLNGVYPFGKHPLDLIEVDHSQLDIYLVDRYKRLPIGRPYLTIAIDVYSRMIYGYYLSFDPPNYLSVGECFLTGILPKDEILKKFKIKNEWNISGIPKNILLDNAKEFRSQAFFNFCKQYRIKMRFNPVKKPDLKPHVERIIRTINEAIRDDGISGYILPLIEKKKTQYNPEKKASLTLNGFEEWLINWIVKFYHKRPHGGIKLKEGIDISPSDRYEQGLTDVNNRTVGIPLIPSDWEQLRFDLLPFERRKLQRDGIRLFNLKYYHKIISSLREFQKSQKKQYIVRYDPRDIREIYLWDGKSRRYYNLSIKNIHPLLEIDPYDPLDLPLSLKEFNKIKHSRSIKKPITSRELTEELKKRQKIIKKEINKTKTAKRARKRNEKIQHYKSKATSTQVRLKDTVKDIDKIEDNNFEKKEMKDQIPKISFDDSQKDSNENLKNYKPKILPVSFYEEKKYEEKNKDE